MQKIPFNQAWRFYFGDYPEGRWREPDDSNWRLVDLPHDWSIQLPRDPNAPCGTSGGYFPTGRGYYRKWLIPPEEWRGKTVLVEFEGVYMNAEVWLNEHFLGRHPYGYTSFHVDLTPYLQIGVKNVLKVLVDNAAQLNSRWYSGSGIYRPAWLRLGGSRRIIPWGLYVTTPEINSSSAMVRLQVTLQNDEPTEEAAAMQVRIYAPDGGLAAQEQVPVQLSANGEVKIDLDLPVASPQLWSPETPALYRLEAALLISGLAVDEESTSFGIRSISFDPRGGFRLNGQSLKLKGGCVHHDNGILGAASFPRSEERKVELLKASGFNAIRCAHNPPAPAFLDACDRLGMLVIDEAFDCWRDGKNPYDYHVVFDDWWQRDLDSMLIRDRNHPCVILWSIGNELVERDNRGGGAGIAKRLADRVHEIDPTRPVTAAICGVWNASGGEGDWSSMDPVFAALDVGGYNYQFRQYRSDRERLPNRMICGLESTPGEALDTWSLVEELDNVVGDFVWTSLDYLGESGIGRVKFDVERADGLGDYPWHQANCGDLDLCGFKRPQSYYRDMLWGHGEKLYIAVHTPIPEGKTPTLTYWGWPDVWPNWTWPGYEGQVFKVDIYSPLERVELFLNGVSLGTKLAGRKKRYLTTFEVPYQPGELKAVGYTKRKPMAETMIATVSSPTRLRLIPDRPVIPHTGPDGLANLSFITAEIVDKHGRVHPAADRPVYFTVQGQGALAAVGNGNPISTENYYGNMRSTYRGRCLAVVKSATEPGMLRLRAQADGLEGAEVTIQMV